LWVSHLLVIVVGITVVYTLHCCLYTGSNSFDSSSFDASQSKWQECAVLYSGLGTLGPSLHMVLRQWT